MKIKHLALALVAILVFVQCGENKEKKTTESSKKEDQAKVEKEKIKEGQKIVQASFKALSTQLKKALQDSGVAHALQYCNTAAYPLTDSLSEAYDVDIKRTAINYRNPDNAPSVEEKEMMQYFAQLLSDKQEPGDSLVHKNGTYTYYNPIVMMGQCQKCHGKPGVQIAENDFNLINELYPEDRAINFKTGDLRGMWVVRWEK